MDFSKVIFVLFCGISMVMGGTRYIAIPIDGMDIFELNPIAPPTPQARLPRQTHVIHPTETESPAQRPERSTAEILDFVDFGAHTGANGAYSWYADYPSHH
ncbi:uncharacterized protein LOC117180074 [Belonocnema kinseyi]|uniref:uncharacterized protein LOC117180074 n=1 Tax=Belonocnema kinseyi TaxID=2817044 RepID=UPI00143CCB03|nr:uncharacterized protein LOC117180074 [Belonocnema kinseyi]